MSAEHSGAGQQPGDASETPACIITGASAGIGAAAALQLAELGQRVVLVGRSPHKLEAVAERLASRTGRRPDTLGADFAELDDVRRLAARLRESYPRIGVLANNAGLVARGRQLTGDGFELMMQVNHLAPVLLTNLLLDHLTSQEEARVVTTASAAATGGMVDPDNLGLPARGRGGWLAYASSKQANILFTSELARRLEGSRVTATCFHPGTIRSDFGTRTLGFSLLRLVPFALGSPDQGARTLVHLATSPSALRPGGYFVSSHLAGPPPTATNPDLARRLWDASLTAVGLDS